MTDNSNTHYYFNQQRNQMSTDMTCSTIFHTNQISSSK